METDAITLMAFLALSACATGQQNPGARPCPKVEASAPAGSVQAGDFLELQRTACYGTCPIFTVRLYGDGRLVWHGERFVKKVGEAEGSVPAAKAVAMLESARAQGFWGLCEEYTESVTDLPTTLTRLSLGGKLKQVSEYGRHAATWLQELDAQMDRFTAEQGWQKAARGGAQ